MLVVVEVCKKDATVTLTVELVAVQDDPNSIAVPQCQWC